MNAKEAREISKKFLDESIEIRGLLDKIYERVKEQAIKGETILYHPFSNLVPCLSYTEREALIKRLHKEGYVVMHHPDPDPGHVCSSDYYTLSW